jgi:hypothetical protein
MTIGDSKENPISASCDRKCQYLLRDDLIDGAGIC